MIAETFPCCITDETVVANDFSAAHLRTYMGLSPEPQIQTSPNFLCMLGLPMSVGWSFSGGTIIRYALPASMAFFLASTRHIICQCAARKLELSSDVNLS